MWVHDIVDLDGDCSDALVARLTRTLDTVRRRLILIFSLGNSFRIPFFLINIFQQLILRIHLTRRFIVHIIFET